MRNAVLILLFGICFILIQGSLFKLIAPQMVMPNLIVALVVYIAFTFPTGGGALLSFFVGLEYDLFISRTLLGPYAASSVAIFALTAFLAKKVFFPSVATIVIVSFFACLLNQLVYIMMALQFLDIQFELISAIWIWLVEAVLTAVLSPLVFSLLRKAGIGLVRERGLA